MKRYLSKLLSEALGNMYANGQIFALPKFELDPARTGFGDYTTNVAFTIAREGKVNPNEAAQMIATELQHLDAGAEQRIAETKVVNGFVNIYVAADKAAELVFEMQSQIKTDPIGLSHDGTPTKVVFEYSSPNTNKPLHIGHTRNDTYGVACINLLKETGHDVVSTEIINDRGIHIMKSMLMYMKHGAGATPQSEGLKPDHFVGKFYVMFAEQCAESEEVKTRLETEAQELLQKWEAGDANVRALWKQMNEWWFEGVEQTYKREGSTFDQRDYESDIYDKGRELVLAGVEKGVFKKDDDGSVSVDLSEKKLDTKVLLRKDGTTLYITQDMYLWDLRNSKYHPDRAMVTTSSEQSYHFAVLKELFTLLGYQWADNFQHLPYEHVYLGNNKMSSRGGNTIAADDLLATTMERVRETMKASQKIKASHEDDALVETVAFAAIKYGYLKYDRNTKIYFDVDQTIAIEGNTGPYLQYAYARIQSVLKKAGKFDRAVPSGLAEAAELDLMKFLLQYNDAVVNAAREFKPNLVCSYLFELASKFSLFYDKVSILGAESEKLKLARLNLLVSVANVLQHGLALLGIKVLEEM